MAAGADYVVVSESDYQSFFSGTVSPARANDQSLNAARHFYSELFKKGTLMWSRDRGPVPYLQPGLEIYHVPKTGDVAKTKNAGNEAKTERDAVDAEIGAQ